MLLGELMSKVQEPSFAEEALLALDDLVLMARINAAAAAADLPPGEFIAQAIGVFVNRGADEEWLSVIGLMSRSDNPAQAFLHFILSKATAQRTH